MDDIVEMYSISELKDHTEIELLTRLKTVWGYSKDQPFDVIGRLKKILAISGGMFFILEELRSSNDGSVLLYPVRGKDVRHTVFVGPLDNTQLGGNPVDGKWVIARVELSPEKERIKHKNPFALKIVNSGIKLLQFKEYIYGYDGLSSLFWEITFIFVVLLWIYYNFVVKCIY